LTATATGTIGGSTSTDNAIVRADSTSNTVQDSGLTIDDTATATQRNVTLRVGEPIYSITADAGTDVVTATGHNYADGDTIQFLALTGGAGLSVITRYFVRDTVAATSFKVATSSGGAAVNITSNATAGTVQRNSTLVLCAGGLGGIVAGPKPDGTAFGGNARGARMVVDLQQWRSNAARVASADFSVIIGGYDNTASGTVSAVCGGESNTASGSYAAVLAGRTSTASGGDAICIGSVSLASGNSSHVVGEDCAATAANSMAVGYRSLADRNILSVAFGRIGGTRGDCQAIDAVLRGTTTTNAAVELLTGSAGINRLTCPSGKVMFMGIKIVGVSNGGGTVATFERQYAIKNVGGTTSEIYAPVTIGSDSAASTSIAISADDTNDSVKIECTGLAATNIRWAAHISAVEVAHA
jgi:hypothetical protein